VLVKLIGSGVCHSDLSAIKGDMPQPLPIVLGHEGAGIVEKVGPGVTTLQPGDHVILMVSYSCGNAVIVLRANPPCVSGIWTHWQWLLSLAEQNICIKETRNWAISWVCQLCRVFIVNERQAVKIRDDAPLEVVCLLGCGVSTA